MTDDEAREAFKKESTEQRLAHAEPGIALKVSDGDEQKEIADVVTELTEKPVLASLPSPEMLEQLAVSSDLKADEKQKELEPAEGDKPFEGIQLVREVRKLPLIWSGVIVTLLSIGCAPQALVLGYFYAVFCQYRTARVIRNVTGAKYISPTRVLFNALIPLYLVIGMFPFAIVGRMVANTAPQFINVLWFPIGVAGCAVLGYIFFQWRWPILQSIALREYEDKHGKLHNQDPAWLVHGATGLLLNMVPVFFLSYTAIYSILIAPWIRSFGGLGYTMVGVVAVFGLIISQYVGYAFLKRRVRDAVALDPNAKALLNRKTKIPVKVSDDDFIVRYRGFAEFERWFKQRFSQPSYKKLFYMLAVLFVFLAVGAPQMALKLLTSTPAMMAGGMSGNALALASSENINFLNMFQGLIFATLAAIGIVYLSKPTHLGMSPKGIRFLWRHAFLEYDGRYHAWDWFKQIRLVMPPRKTSPTDQVLMFDANSQPQNVNVKLACVLEVDDRERILKSIETFAPGVERDASVLQTLQPPADHSYTELWLQALTAPPKRERFKPLSEGAILSNGKFKVVGQLGVGGQGTAYLATDTETQQSVVLKEFILPVYVDVAVRRQALERFENEARILKHLDHDQIVKLIDFFVEDHRSYLVLEHIEGKSLKQIVEERGPLPESEVISLTKQMCTMLHYMHGLSPPVVHRDFTPDNLILRSDGKLKLVDFNVAQQTDSTATGTVVGKHSYLPPEQFRGTPVPQSDLYSLGATLHYLLTGQDPEPISVSRPQRINPEVSEAMNMFVAKATAMTLEARHQDVAELEKEWTDFFGVSAALEDGLLDDQL